MKAKYSLVAVIFCLAISFSFAVSSEAKINPKNIIGMWLFDDDEGDVATDSSGNGNDGTLTNNPDWADGKFGSALEFDGATSYVSCGNGPTLDITDDITVMAWVNFGGVDYKNGSGGLFTIAAKGYPDSLAPHAGWWFSHDNRNNGQGFGYTCFGKKAGGWAGGGNNLSGGNFQFEKGDWYHMALTVGKSVGKLYVNGAQVGADKVFADLVLSDVSRDLTIGSAGTSWHFNGLIDEFTILNVALDEDEIQKAMNDGLEKVTGLSAVDFTGKLITNWASIKSQ